MNQTEKRRRQLLEQTRSLYYDNNVNPAVRPRYHASYQKLYADEGKVYDNTLGYRFLVCVVLLTMFLSMKYYGTTIGGFTDLQVVNEIMQNIV